jgi:sacsin
MFSLSPDRARLHHLSDRSTQDQDPAKWNEYLFQILIPVAWAQLLSYVANLYPNQPAFERWPQNIDGTRDPLSNALEKVLSVIDRESLPLWPTDVGYVSSKDGLLYAGVGDAALREALREAGAPVVYVPDQLQQRAKGIFKDRILRPEHLCHFLRGTSDKIKSWSHGTKYKIVEYLISESGFTDYGGLKLFPFMDGSHQSIGNGLTFVHRDEFEESLFSLDKSQTLDLKKLSQTTQLALQRRCENSTIHPSICYRSANALRDYCMRTHFEDLAKDQDMVVLGQEAATFVSKVWTWISMRGIDILDTNISCLWLLPLSNGQHRKIRPRTSASRVYLAPAGEVGDLMRNLDAKSSAKPLPLLDTRPTGFAPQSELLLMQSLHAKSTVFIEDGSSIISFLQWLHRTSPILDGVADKERQLIAKLVVSDLSKPLISTERETIFEVLRNLKIFQKVSWIAEKGRMWATLFLYLFASTNRL